MSFFSNIGSKISSAYNTAKSYVSKALSYVSGAPSSANASSALQGRYLAPGTSISTGIATSGNTGASGSWSSPTTIGITKTPSGSNYMPSGQMDSGNNLNVSSLPVQINAGQQKVSGGGGSSASQIYNSYGPVAPSTISAKNLGESIGTFGSGSLQQGGVSTGSNALVLNSSPGSINANGVDTTKLAGSMAGYYKRNPTTGVMEPVEDMSAKQNETDQQTADRISKMMANLMPEKESVYNDPQVRQAQQRRYDIQQQLLAPTNELNAVIAKQNQDLLQLRQTGSKEGVTEAVYGGQSNAINYNAAIRALPLQASIAGLQGDLKLAQDYLTELTQIKTEQINNQYEYNKNLYGAISSAITEKDKKIYEEKLLANENARKDNLDLESFKEKIAFNAMQQGASSNITSRILSASNKVGAIEAAGQYGADTIAQNTKQVQYENAVLQNTKLRNEIDANTPITGEFASVINGAAGLVPSTKKTQVKQNIANALTNGNYANAYAEIANAVSDGITGENKTKFDNARTDYEIMSNFKTAITDYANSGGNMGLLTGTAEDIKRKLGIDSGKATAMATQLWREFQTYRSNMTGAAFSPEESRDYASVNPTLGKSLKLNLNVIDGAMSQLENRVVSTVNARIPDAKKIYELASGSTSTAPQVTVTADDNELFNSIVPPPTQSSGTVRQYEQINSPLFNLFK